MRLAAPEKKQARERERLRGRLIKSPPTPREKPSALCQPQNEMSLISVIEWELEMFTFAFRQIDIVNPKRINLETKKEKRNKHNRTCFSEMFTQVER